MRSLSLLLIVIALGCRSPGTAVRTSGGVAPGVDATDAAADIRVPRRTRPVFASDQYGLMVQVPDGLYYCAIPPDWVGSDHGRAFYIEPPAACDTTAGYVLSSVAEAIPTLELYYGYNVVEHDFDDGRGEREAEEDAEVARQHCEQPERLAGVTLLGRPAVGCRTEERGRVTVSAVALYEAEHAVGREPLNAQLVVSLTTDTARLVKDWAAFVAFAAGVAQCTPNWEAAEWGAARATGDVRGGPRWPACPDDFW
jgi:hypothetical protein